MAAYLPRDDVEPQMPFFVQGSRIQSLRETSGARVYLAQKPGSAPRVRIIGTLDAANQALPCACIPSVYLARVCQQLLSPVYFAGGDRYNPPGR